MMRHHNYLVQKLFVDKHGKFVLGQKPNLPIIVWAVCTVANWFIGAKTATTILHVTGTTAWTVWALLETGWGVNLFRRILGAIVIIWTLIGIFG
jgi:hypothetical protein